MEQSPERPPGIPAAAIWNPDLERWEEADTNAAGEKHGPFRQWRADGTLYRTGQYVAGRDDGGFLIYHPNGQVARRGAYVEGELDGVVNAFATDGEMGESLRACCVPTGAWEMRARYERGRLMRESFFDREGRALLSDGTPRPERPAAIPSGAEYDEFSARWAAGEHDEEGSARGTWRWWTREGTLDEESTYESGRKAFTRLLAPDGSVRLEARYAAERVRHGAWRQRFAPTEETPYADPRIREERGAFHQGQAVGPWSFHDGDGNELRRVDRGRPFDPESAGAAAALGDEERSASDWEVLAAGLRGEGHVREALVATARAAARRKDAGALRAALEEIVIPLASEALLAADAALGEASDESLAPVLSALLGGGDPSTAFRTAASLLKGANRAALDLVDAAILLAPDRGMTYLTRALVRIELGDPDGARADADRVAAESPDTAEFVRNYVRLLFPSFAFWPAAETPTSALEGMPEEPGQPLAAIRGAMGTYATRLGIVRGALAALAPGASWLPPDVGALLPDGPVELRSYVAQMADEAEDGTIESTEVTIDETLNLAGWGIPALMRLARVQWTALAWLSWSAGQEEVALPTEIAAPPAFPAAIGMAITRHWRAQDAVVTGGLRSMTAGVPGFVWEGLEIEGIPKLFAEMARDEYLEMRSVFLWMTSAENLSPFQSDLRQA